MFILPVRDYIEGLFENTLFVGFALIVTGVLLFISDRCKRGTKNELSTTLLDVLIIGVFQAAAVVPGISRSGATISAGIYRKTDREFAVRLSFLMSLPAIIGAAILNLKDALEEGINTDLLGQYSIGFLSSIIFGYLSINLVKYIVKKGKFGGFAYYCWIAGAVAIILTIAL